MFLKAKCRTRSNYSHLLHAGVPPALYDVQRYEYRACGVEPPQRGVDESAEDGDQSDAVAEAVVEVVLVHCLDDGGGLAVLGGFEEGGDGLAVHEEEALDDDDRDEGVGGGCASREHRGVADGSVLDELLHGLGGGRGAKRRRGGEGGVSL